jgi:signal peptidase I
VPNRLEPGYDCNTSAYNERRNLRLCENAVVVVKSTSMEPNLIVEDILEIDEDYYSANSIKRFDIVLASRTEKDLTGSRSSYELVARVIGLGGETVSLKDNKVFINKKVLKEPFTILPCHGPDEDYLPCANFGPLEVAPGEVFLLADNRAGSEDGRLWRPHTLTRSQIVGKVINVLKPPKSKSITTAMVFLNTSSWRSLDKNAQAPAELNCWNAVDRHH